MARFRKTPQAQRTTYRQLDENGRVLLTVTPDSFGGDVDLVQREKNEAFIKACHSMDDHEVYENCKEIALTPEEKEEYDERRDKFIHDFTEEYGYEPDPEYVKEVIGTGHRSYEPVDSEQDGDNEDSINPGMNSSRQAEVLSTDLYGGKRSAFLDTVTDLADTKPEFTDKERILLHLFIEGDGERTFTEIAQIMGITSGRTSQLFSSLKKKLKKYPEILNFVRLD